MPKIPRSFGTHDGSFHADEVTACALLLLFHLIDEDKIVRTRNPASLVSCEFICDVGGVYDPAQKMFDHHQVDYEGQLSSAGMVLLYLLNERIISQHAYDFLNQSIIDNVDAHDNGRETPIPGVCTYSHIIANYNPIYYHLDPASYTEAFFMALQFAKGHFERLWRRYEYMCSCREIVAKTMEKYKDCLIFEDPIPWQEIFFELGGEKHPASFVIMPSGHYWKLRGIPPSLQERMKVRHPLPQEWAGLLEEDLKRISGIPGAIFCHKGRFISVWQTKEDAIKALHYTLKNS